MMSSPPWSVTNCGPVVVFCDLVAISAKLLPSMSRWMKPLSPRIVSVPLALSMVSPPMPPRMMLLPSPRVIVSVSPVAAMVSVVSYLRIAPLPSPVPASTT